MSELEELASRAGGPGGQHVNTSSTRVTLRWNLRESCGLSPEAKARALAKLASRVSREGVVVVHADGHRSRHRNRQDARDRLQALIERALAVEAPRHPTRPTRASKTRRVDEKRRRGVSKQRRQRLPDDD